MLKFSPEDRHKLCNMTPDLFWTNNSSLVELAFTVYASVTLCFFKGIFFWTLIHLPSIHFLLFIQGLMTYVEAMDKSLVIPWFSLYLPPTEWDGIGHRAAFTATSGIWEKSKYEYHDQCCKFHQRRWGYFPPTFVVLGWFSYCRLYKHCSLTVQPGHKRR